MPISQLKPGMKLSKDVILSDGRLLLLAGFAIKPLYIRKLEAFNVPNVFVEDGPFTPMEDFEEERVYNHAATTIKNIFSLTKNDNSVEVSTVRESVSEILQKVIENETVMLQITGIRDIDNYTFLHSVDVCIYSTIIGKKLGFSENFRFLMASGNAVCGSSAIAATAPVIGATDTEKGITITIVNFTGTILMLLLPFIAQIVFNLETIKTSAFIGGILQSVGQVVASGSLVNEPVKDLATIFKIVRIIFLVFVVLSFGAMKNRSSESNSKKSTSKAKVPWYVTGFFIMCFLFTLGVISPHVSKIFKLISNNFEIIALAGIGMRVNFRELIKQGVKASIYALSIATIQIVSAILLISVLL